jgi:acyl-CoA thioesterase-1
MTILIFLCIAMIVVIPWVSYKTHIIQKKFSEPKPVEINDNETIRYLPLGDSYTIGESIPASDNFPNQLSSRIRANKQSIQIVENPARTGYTTNDLIEKELPLVQKYSPSMVTLLIGVNDFVQGIDVSTFKENFEYLVTQLQQQLPTTAKIILITIPDFSKTPTGARFGPADEMSSGVAQFNQVIKDLSIQKNLPLADIFEISQKSQNDRTLISRDGLHPSASEYSQWVDIIIPYTKTTISADIVS